MRQRELGLIVLIVVVSGGLRGRRGGGKHDEVVARRGSPRRHLERARAGDLEQAPLDGHERRDLVALGADVEPERIRRDRRRRLARLRGATERDSERDEDDDFRAPPRNDAHAPTILRGKNS